MAKHIFKGDPKRLTGKATTNAAKVKEMAGAFGCKLEIAEEWAIERGYRRAITLRDCQPGADTKRKMKAKAPKAKRAPKAKEPAPAAPVAG